MGSPTVPHLLRLVAATGATVAYAWWTTELRPFTWPALVAVGAAGVAAMVAGSRRRGASRASGSGAARGVLAWGVLLALLAGWELAAYLQHPRPDHPTLSSLANQVLDRQPARTVAFLAWLVVGADLARR